MLSDHELLINVVCFPTFRNVQQAVSIDQRNEKVLNEVMKIKNNKPHVKKYQGVFLWRFWGHGFGNLYTEAQGPL